MDTVYVAVLKHFSFCTEARVDKLTEDNTCELSDGSSKIFPWQIDRDGGWLKQQQLSDDKSQRFV